MNYGNKILIMGGSCAGKSTTAERLGKKLNMPVMHMDLYDPYAVSDATERNTRKKLMQDTIQETIAQQKWIIEGVYQWYAFEERMNAADVLVVLRHQDAPYDLIMETAKKHNRLRVVELKSFSAMDKFINNYSR